MRVIDIAVVMLIFQGSLAIVNEIDPFGLGDNRPRFDEGEVVTESMMQSYVIGTGTVKQETSIFGFIQRGAESIINILQTLKHVIFMGSLVNEIMTTGFTLPLPGSLVVLLNALSSFIYALAIAQIFMKFKVE